MTYDEALERIDAYLAGDLPLEAVQELEAWIAGEPLLAMAVGLRRLEPLAGEQIAAGIAPMESGPDPHFPRLWLLSLLAGSVVIGTNGRSKKKKTAKTSPAPEIASRAASGRPEADLPPPGPADAE